MEKPTKLKWAFLRALQASAGTVGVRAAHRVGPDTLYEVAPTSCRFFAALRTVRLATCLRQGMECEIDGRTNGRHHRDGDALCRRQGYIYSETRPLPASAGSTRLAQRPGS